MISNTMEYQRAEAELRDLQARLERLQKDHPLGDKGFVKAGVRKLISRLNEELGVFEASEEARAVLPG